jgi:hypothetical protein
MLMCSALTLGATWCTFGLFAVSIWRGVRSPHEKYGGFSFFWQHAFSCRMPPNTTRVISLEEIAKHNTDTDCWIIVEGNVYDATPYLSNHPGGKDIILQHKGAFHPVSLTRIRAVPPRLARACASSPLPSQTAVTPFPAPIPTLTPRARRAAQAATRRRASATRGTPRPRKRTLQTCRWAC